MSGVAPDDPLAVELEDQPQGRVGGGMLRPEVEGPGGLLRFGLELRLVEQLGRHRVILFSFRPRGSSRHDSPRVSRGKLCRSPRPRSG